MCLVLLNVFIRYSNIRVASLVACNYHAFGISQIPDARVLQTAELVASWPTKGFTNLLPLLVKHVRSLLRFPWHKVVAEEKVI